MKNWVLAALVGIFIIPGAYANVTLKNGNFFIGYVDIIYKGGFEPKIDRVYNSKTNYKGLFGWNWGTEYEAYLRVSADGSVVVHEYGGGAENRFSPLKFSQREIEDAVNKVAKAAQSVGAFSKKSDLIGYKKKLKGNAHFRNQEWEKFVQAKKLAPRKLKPGTQLQSNRFSYQYITKLKSGYVRKSDSGRLEYFDEKGQLVKVADKNKNFVKLSYDRSGKLRKLVDNANRKMFFEINSRGLITKITGVDKLVALFKYNKFDELIYSRDVDGHAYKYKYSDSKLRRHNLIEIMDKDRTTMKMAYRGMKENENIHTVKERDGTLTEYIYGDRKKKNNFSVGVIVKAKSGVVISKARYEYFLKYKPSGEEWTYKLITDLDGNRTETVYNMCCGLPLLIKRNGKETTFAYDRRGHVTLKETSSQVTKLDYNSQCGKVTKVIRYSKRNPKRQRWSKFKYDKSCNLTFARNSSKKGVKLHYDRFGRIASMVDQDRRRLTFEYNEQSKPIKITDPKLGSISVSYKNSGQINKIESSAGRSIASKVSSAFKNLLGIIQPAGVTLTF